MESADFLKVYGSVIERTSSRFSVVGYNSFQGSCCQLGKNVHMQLKKVARETVLKDLFIDRLCRDCDHPSQLQGSVLKKT